MSRGGTNRVQEDSVIDEMKSRSTFTGPSHSMPRIARVVLALGAIALVERAILAASIPAHAAAAQQKTFPVRGEAENTVTDLKPTGDFTLHLEAAQVGHLTRFGHFTGQFAYDAELFAEAIVLHGTATLTNEQGEQLFVTADILETGTVEPLDVTGTLTITGGTGRFDGASGSLAVSGVDGESLVDTVHLEGAIVTPGT
jgi:hypothetical protein